MKAYDAEQDTIVYSYVDVQLYDADLDNEMGCNILYWWTTDFTTGVTSLYEGQNNMYEYPDSEIYISV